jgi:hypothetical protein
MVSAFALIRKLPSDMTLARPSDCAVDMPT